MSTRCVTKFFDSFDDKQIACIFRHCDGYPEGHGRDLAKFLNSRVVVTGLDGFSIPGKVKANGMGRLAAQMVAALQRHELRIDPPRRQRWDEEYVYEVRHDSLKAIGVLGRRRVLYDGPWDGYEAWLKKYEREEE